MREILFRGKRVNNGEWIEGFYAHSGEKKYIVIDNDIAVGYLAMKEVNPDTIGQYTGLTDKNGKKIFEGDIVKIKGKTRYVFYGSSGFRHTNYGEYADTLENVFTVVDCEVIGNKIDNPELLRDDTERLVKIACIMKRVRWVTRYIKQTELEHMKALSEKLK